MTEKEALEIVLDLAEQNLLEDDDPGMAEEVERQNAAVDIVHDMIEAML